MENNNLNDFINKNADRHEIFHEGYNRGLREGFFKAARDIIGIIKILEEIQKEKL